MAERSSAVIEQEEEQIAPGAKEEAAEGSEGKEQEKESKQGEKKKPQQASQTFTQEDVNRLLQKEKKGWDRKFEEAQAQTQKTIAELQARIPVVEPPKDDLKGQMELMENRYKQQITSLQQQVETTSSQLKLETIRRLETERDKELNEALAAVCCIDPIGGQRYFKEQLEYDDSDQKWLFRTKSGGLVTILDGVTESLPPYLRPSQMPQGGSGTPSRGSPKLASKQRQLDVEKKKLADMHEKTSKTGGRMSDVLAYKKQKEIVTALERDLSGVPS
jgi:hypothetical protein